ncbi:WD40 repeat-like protein, partial [Lentinula edodes]
RQACIQGTRVPLMEQIIKWAEDTSDTCPPIFWLCGMAGTGKSTLAYSICEYFDLENQQSGTAITQHPSCCLGGSFFCSRQIENLRQQKYIIPTISDQLSNISFAFANALSRAESRPNGHIVQKQMDTLLIQPWQRSLEMQLPEICSYLVVIDALDEVEHDQGSQFLENLIKTVQHASPRCRGLKFLITSPPNPNIVSTCQGLNIEATYWLQDLGQASAIADVRCFLEAHLSKMDLNCQQLDQLACKSQGLFIYASTMVRYIQPDGVSRKQRNARLEAMLSDSPSQEHSKEFLIDILYRQILSEALGEKDTDIYNVRLKALHTLGCLQQPLPIASISQLLLSNDKELDVEAVQITIQRLYAIAYISEKDHCVYIYHKSFLDFLSSPTRAQEFIYDTSTQHALIAQCCFDIMQDGIHFNMCSLPSAYILDSEVPRLQEEVQKKFNNWLQYSCLFWATHLIKGHISGGLNHQLSLLKHFGEHRAIFWIEGIMNLLRFTRECKEIMSDLQKWINKENIMFEDLKAIVTAVERLARSFIESPACLSTPHLYISSLATEFATGQVPEMWKQQFLKLPQITCAGVSNHGGVKLAMNVKASVLSVAFSNDVSHIVSGSDDMTVCIWDANTGDLLQTLKGHTDRVWSVGFSSDGKCIVSGSDDKTVRIWDANTGEHLRTLKGHTGWVLSVAFSDDSTRIVSGSSDKAMHIWDANNGNHLQTLIGHTNYVRSVGFSHNNSFIVSSSSDKTVRVWNAHTGGHLQTLKGHTSWVLSVGSSHDGTCIVSGSSDKTVHIWDASTGEQLYTLQGHNDCVLSVEFSKNDSHIASGSSDKTVCIWDADTKTCLQTLKGHTDYVRSAGFSGDGSRIVSGSFDKTVHIWDAITGEQMQTLEGHTGGVNSITISNDGTRIVSGSDDKTLCIWNASMGEHLQTLKGHSAWVLSARCSNKGSYIVSGSSDRTVRIWDMNTGECLQIFEGHTDDVRSVEFSNNDTYIVSGSSDKTVCLWNAYTGEKQQFQGHTGGVNSDIITPDETCIISGSDNKTLCIWNANTGAHLQTLKAHTASVRSVSLSNNNCYIVSGSDDQTLCIWDIITGGHLQTLYGHIGGVNSIGFSKDDSHIVSGSDDQTVHIWDAKTGNHLQMLRGHNDRVWSVGFIHNGSHIVSGSEDKTVRIWDANTGEHLQSTKCTNDMDLVKASTNINYQTYVMWLPPPLMQPLPNFPCLKILSRMGQTSVTYSPEHIGPGWVKCY